MTRWTRVVVRGISFWTAVLLPLLYLPLLVAGGTPLFDQVVLWRLVALNVVALVIGHSYDGTIGQVIGWT